MVLETADLVQTAVLRSASGYDNNGEPKVAAAKEINCRWVEGQQEAQDANGNPIRIDVTVVVDQAVPLGSVMWQGTILANPTASTDSMYRVVTRKTTTDVKGNHTRRTLGLVQYSNEAPATA